MGYTHYFTFKKDRATPAKEREVSYQLAVRQCQRILRYYNKQFQSGDIERLSGYSAHCKTGSYHGINFNGAGEYAHENLLLREHFNQNESFNFCKTARKPYDTCVTACLIVLKHYLGDNVDIGSDGERTDWIAGLFLVRSALTLKTIQIPNTVENRGTRLKLVK